MYIFFTPENFRVEDQPYFDLTAYFCGLALPGTNHRDIDG